MYWIAWVEVMDLPQAHFQGYVTAVPHPDIENLRMPGIHIGFSGTPSSIRRPPPRLGEHTREVLSAAGYAEIEVEALEAAGVV